MSKARQIKHQQASSSRRQHLLRTHSAASGSARFGEVVGGTLAECAVVCCCCPCGLINLLVLALYKVPAGLCRRAMRNKRRRKVPSKGLLPRCKCECEEVETPVHPIGGGEDSLSDLIESRKSEELNKEAMELEKEMWDMFYSTGFWRSCSTRESTQKPIHSVDAADSLCHLTSPQPDCR
ncbi:hypothetical protein QN277_013208 [Acacia crassicarpa]|uniref:Pollen preferential protein n=1 Tax=Acacia crassicarpa TaxID=499986 RepID=A0AAE1N2S9_9FABA|nr:hypothetical protein QN277_013208 [Acacia crassicarpa]